MIKLSADGASDHIFECACCSRMDSISTVRVEDSHERTHTKAAAMMTLSLIRTLVDSPSSKSANPEPFHLNNFVLSIDKIAVTYADPIPSNVASTCNRMIESHRASRFAKSRLSSCNSHILQMTIPIDSDHGPNPGTFLMQADSRLPSNADYRFEFNPNTIGIGGVKRIQQVLDELVGRSGRFVFTQGTITRIDLAIDLRDLSADDVIIWNKGRRKFGVFTNQNGVPENLYLGGARSNQTAAYNKSNKAMGTPIFRIEQRIKPRCLGTLLINLNNPFTKLRMVHTEAIAPLIDAHRPEWFFDAVRIRGFSRIIQTLLPTQRKAIKQILDDPASSLLPSAETIWKQWPSAMIAAGLDFLILDVDATPLVPALSASQMVTGGIN